MGRRSVNTTKSGKFMNPTDQARKEARKKELKKNKKQRIAVRHAVLKAKDPLQLLEETSLYDKQEYDPSVQAHLNERVIQEKRRKLLETFDRLVVLYRKEDAEYANRLQLARDNYDKRRHEMMLYYEQVKLAERVKASEIPLPKLPQSQMSLIASDIPLPIGNSTKGILKKHLGMPGLPPGILPLGKKPPAPPPGTPPVLSESEDEESNLDISRPRKIRFAELEDTARGLLQYNSFSNLGTSLSQIPLPSTMGLPSFNGLIRPAPQPNRFNFQLPGHAVLSAPPNLHMRDPLDNADLVSGPAYGKTSFSQSTPSGTTIVAKPQLKNLIGDATCFVPTALKVRRTVRDSSGRLVTTGGGVSTTGVGRKSSAVYDRIRGSGSMGQQSNSSTSKDDAYEEFMREMEGIL